MVGTKTKFVMNLMTLRNQQWSEVFQKLRQYLSDIFKNSPKIQNKNIEMIKISLASLAVIGELSFLPFYWLLNYKKILMTLAIYGFDNLLNFQWEATFSGIFII